jgi:putative ABC transport system substrate-binding protein
MRRRNFATVVAAAAAWPKGVRAQPARMPVVGWLHPGSPVGSVERRAGFVTGLARLGFVEGRNVAIEYRWAGGDYSRLPALAADLVARKPAAICSGPLNSTLAAKGATSTIPVVFTIGVDPMAYGLVASLNRPGGNLTGVAELLSELLPKRLQLLHELLPKATRIGVLYNASNQNTKANLAKLGEAAATLGIELTLISADGESEVGAAFAGFAQQKLDLVFVADDPYFSGLASQLAALAKRHRIAAFYYDRTFAMAGGLISYGPDLVAMYGMAGDYVGRILKGAKPADLPVMQPEKFQLVINQKTAHALGIDVPATLLARADEVIE